MSKYTADDNRSMQLNDNNDRYYSSRDIECEDFDEQEPSVTAVMSRESSSRAQEFGRWEYNRLKVLWDSWKLKTHNDICHDEKNEYRRHKRYLLSNTNISDLYYQIYWEQ